MTTSDRHARSYDPLMPSSESAAVGTWAWVCAQAELNAERAAASAAAVAARHERLVTGGSESIRRLHTTMATTHRRIESRHRTAARSHRAQVDRLVNGYAPDLLVTVAGALGARGAALTLLGSARYEESAVASNRTAATAQELEFTLGEGPVHDAAESGRLVVANRTTMPARWAHYAPAVTELGVRSVVAAPLCLHRKCIGVLTAFDPPEDATVATVAATVVTVDGVARVLVNSASHIGTELMAGDDRRVVHQATGMIAARLRCPVGDALALLRARAFAENEPIGVLACRVVDREVQFE